MITNASLKRRLERLGLTMGCDAIGSEVKQLALRELSDKDREVLCAFLERGGVSARTAEEKVALEAYRIAEQVAKRKVADRRRKGR